MPKASVLVAAGTSVGLVVGASFLLPGGPRAAPPAAASMAAPPPVAATVAEVVVRPHVETREFTGRFEAVRTVELRARVGGYVEAVHFAEGSRVEAGQLLFQIDPRPFEVAVDRASAELARVQEGLALARIEYERAAQLWEQRVVPEARFDDAAARVRDLEAQVRAATAAVRAAELDLDYTRIVAPIGGRVGRAMATEGDLVAGGAGSLTAAPLATIVSVDPIHVAFDIDEATLLSLPGAAADRLGSIPAEVGLIAGEGFPYAGQVEFLDNAVDPQTGTIRARAAVANPTGVLRPGLFARVRLHMGAPRETVMVADAAVGTDQDRRFVLVLSPGGTVAYREVELGPMADGLRVIRAGLEPGETIAVKGLVRPGMTVTPQFIRMEDAGPTGDAAPAEVAAVAANEAAEPVSPQQ